MFKYEVNFIYGFSVFLLIMVIVSLNIEVKILMESYFVLEDKDFLSGNLKKKWIYKNLNLIVIYRSRVWI